MFLDQVYEQTRVLEARAKNERARVMLNEEERRTCLYYISCLPSGFRRDPIYFNFIVCRIVLSSHVGFSFGTWGLINHRRW